jgi:hypothetical protein
VFNRSSAIKLGDNKLNLASLRPQEPTDITRLSAVLRRQNAKTAALPASLPEPILISVARDLRSLEEPDEEDPGGELKLAAPMMLVLSLMLGHDSGSRFSIGERAMFDSLKFYQWAVEREIVTRLTGVGGQDDTDTLMESLAKVMSDDFSGDPQLV